MSDPQEPSNPRAEAKAAKAYAKALRPWWKKKRVLIPAAFIVLIAIIDSTGGSTSNNTTADASTATVDTSTPAATPADTPAPVTDTYGSAKLPQQDGDWKLQSIIVRSDGLGSFGATARISYTGTDTSGNVDNFTVTLFKGTKLVGTVTGTLLNANPGQTQTVDMTSCSREKYVSGPYKYTFQKMM